MADKIEANVRPWCPFCGHDVGRPTELAQRKMTEFPVGNCECGAVYVCDATGHNVGSAMVECLVYACGDVWDLAWELMPEDDYITDRVENYDEITNRVVAKQNIDGRAVRGLLYFVRLHKDIAEIAQRFRKKQELEVRQHEDPRRGVVIPEVEPEADQSIPKRRTSKKEVKKLAALGDIDTLVRLSLDDKRTLRYLQRLLYQPDAAGRYWIAWIIGQVCARVATREPGLVADLLQRLFEACNDSAAMPWGMVEAIGSIIGGRPDIYGAFTRYILNFLGDSATREAGISGLCEIAYSRPDLIRKTPFYSILHFLEHETPVVRALMVRLLGRIKASESTFQIMALQNDDSEVIIYVQGRPETTTVSALAGEAVRLIQKAA